MRHNDDFSVQEGGCGALWNLAMSDDLCWQGQPAWWLQLRKGFGVGLPNWIFGLTSFSLLCSKKDIRNSIPPKDSDLDLHLKNITPVLRKAVSGIFPQ